MKLYMFVGVLLLVGLMDGGQNTRAEQQNIRDFHPSQTEAEKVLDMILHMDAEDSNLHYYILDQPWQNKSKEYLYKSFFTKALLAAWRKAEKKIVQESCDGNYVDGEVCGLDYSPFFCSNDAPDLFYYTSHNVTHSKVVIAIQGVGWSGFVKNYTLVKNDDKWQLDGVDCGDGFTFNLP